MARRPRRKAPPEPTNLDVIADWLANWDLTEKWEALDGTAQASLIDDAIEGDIDRMIGARAAFWTTNEGRVDLEIAVTFATLDTGLWSELSSKAGQQ